MTKKIWIVLTLMMVLPAMTLMASCAKKKIYSDPSGPQSSDDAARAERARQDALARQRAFDEQQLKDQSCRQGRGAAERTGFRSVGNAKQFCFRRYLF